MYTHIYILYLHVCQLLHSRQIFTATVMATSMFVLVIQVRSPVLTASLPLHPPPQPITIAWHRSQLHDIDNNFTELVVSFASKTPLCKSFLWQFQLHPCPIPRRWSCHEGHRRHSVQFVLFWGLLLINWVSCRGSPVCRWHSTYVLQFCRWACLFLVVMEFDT